MKRVFIAVDISEEARRVTAAHIDDLRRRFRGVRVSWVRPENLHITLKFLGDTSDEQIEKLSKAINLVAKEIQQFKASLSVPLAFGRRVLVIEIADATGNFKEINRLIDDEGEKIGMKRENRPFRPHLTIARIRDKKGTRRLVAEHLRTKIEPVVFEVNAIVLYESKLLPTGSVYSRLSTFLLGRQ